MASDWFGGIGKDLTEFVGEVTKTVQTQVTELKPANEEEQSSSHQPYGAFANESVLDSFFTSINEEDTNINDDNKKENPPKTPDPPHISSPLTSTFSTPSNIAVTPNIEAIKSSEADATHDNNKLRRNTNINNAESADDELNEVEPKTSSAVNKEENMKYEYQQLLAEKTHGDAKYKQLKSKFAKLHSKYKQIKEQNEKQQTLNNALKNNLNETMEAHKKEMDEMKERYASNENELNEKIVNKQSKIEQLVKELNQQAVNLEQKDISIQKYESEGKILRNKLDSIAMELTQIDGLNAQNMSSLKQENERLKLKLSETDETTDANDVETSTKNDEEGASSSNEASISPSYVKEIDTLKKKHLDEVNNWKLMYEELEKTAFKAVQDKNSEKLKADESIAELQQESERLEYNLKLREDQLEKSNIKLSNNLSVLEANEDKIKYLSEEIKKRQNTAAAATNADDSKWSKLIAEKDKEIADIMAEGEDWASMCHNLERKQKKILEELTDLKHKLSQKEEEITSLLETIEGKKTESLSIEERNKLLIKHNEDTSLSNVQLMEEMIAIKSKMKAIEAERDEYVVMIENDKKVIKELNICINSEKKEIENYRDAKKKEEHLLNELMELREEMQRMQSMNSAKYERLQREKRDEKKLRIAAEKRNEELSLEISESTQPLLRQMESIKTSHHERKKIWDKLESDLREKIRNLENDLNGCDAKMNAICSDLEMYKIKENKIEIVNKRLRDENKYFKNKYNEMNDKFDEIQIKYDDIINDCDITQNKLNVADNENKTISNQLNKFNKNYQNERNRFENILATENQKKQELQKTITILQNKLRQFETYQVTILNTEKSSHSSPVIEAIAMNNNNNNSNNNMWTVSRIQNELRQKENELISLKQRLITVQNTNDTFGDEIVKLKSQNEGLTKYHHLYKNQIKQINALKLRYEAAIDIVIDKEKQIQQLANS